MDERRARIYDDLRGLVEGELGFEPLDRAPYAIDGGLHEIDPLGVVAPRWDEDVVRVVQYAAENRIPLHVRGAGTDNGGGVLGPGLVLDLSRHFRKVESIDGDRVTVEAGVVLDELNALLAPRGRRVEPIPADSDVSTVGGMIAVNASGTRSPRHGAISDRVERLHAVLSQGDATDLGFVPWPEYEAEAVTFRDLIVKKMQTLYRSSRARLERVAASCPLNRAGYALERAASDQGIDLARLAVGSEGTLAIILRGVLRTVPISVAQGVVVASFGKLSESLTFAAAAADPAIGASSTTIHDRRAIRLACDKAAAFRQWIEPAAEAVVVVEFEADLPDLVQAGLRLVRDRAMRAPALATVPFTTEKRMECERILGLGRLVEPWLMRPRTRTRPVSFLDDVAAPRDQMVAVSRRLRELFQRMNVTWTMSGHGDGRLRFRPFLDLSSPDDQAKLEPLAAGFHEIVVQAGGTISSGHALGLVRTPFLRLQYGELIQVFHEVKQAFDPQNLLNPGKVVGDDPRLLSRDLRVRIAPARPADSSVITSSSSSAETPALVADSLSLATAPAALEPIESVQGALRWPELSLVETASACNGCGTCRTLDPTWRMCPSFRATRREEASPRGQANLIRQIAAGLVDPRLWGSEELKARADLCIHCKLCESECPSGVDVSSLMLEAKAAYVENHGLSPSDWIFSRIEMWARLGARLPILTNLLLRGRGSRWLLERLMGLSSRRILPRVSRTSFIDRAARMGLVRPRPQLPGPRVAYFVDVYANYYDQELAESVVSVLQLAQVHVFVPPRQRASGMSALIVGDVDHAREQALANLRVLANAVRDGYTIVCSEPTAALMIRREYTRLTEDLDAALVAANTMEVGQYLLGLEERGLLPRPSEPLSAKVGYHQPCHLRALDVGMPGYELMRRVVGLDVEFIDRGCSGMGGTYGLARDRFWPSRRSGRGLLRRLREGDIEIGSTECGACRIQMEQGIPKRTLHPVKLLAMGYGLNPTLRQHFKDPKPRHVMA